MVEHPHPQPHPPPSNINYIKTMCKITYYMYNNSPQSPRNKYPLFATGGGSHSINIFSNSLEHMGDIYGHKDEINCIAPLSNTTFASGSSDNNIKIWKLKPLINIYIYIRGLSQHTAKVCRLCNVKSGVLVSGGDDNCLIIWEYTNNIEGVKSRVLRGHETMIVGIVKIDNNCIISGEWAGDLRIWNLGEGVCIKHLPSAMNNPIDCLRDIKFLDDLLAANFDFGVVLYGKSNNYEEPIRKFEYQQGFCIEIVSEGVFAREGEGGNKLEILDLLTGHSALHPILVSTIEINHILCLAHNLLVLASGDGTVIVIEPKARKRYMKFVGNQWIAVAAKLY